MTLLEVLQDIGAQCNDPELDALKDRAKSHFFKAVSHLLSSDDFVESDVPGLMVTSTQTMESASFTGADNWGMNYLVINNVYKMIGFYEAPYGNTTWGNSDKFITLLDRGRTNLLEFKNNPEMQPKESELFVIQDGDTYTFFINETSNWAFSSGHSFSYTYIADFNGNNLGDASLIAPEAGTLNYIAEFSYVFTRKAISMAVVTLLAEDQE